MRKFAKLLPLLTGFMVFVAMSIPLLAPMLATAQVKPKALTGVLVVTVDGKTVTLTDAEKTELARTWPAIKAALPIADQPAVDWQAALTSDQRVLVGTDLPDAWTPDSLVTKWKAGGANLTRAQAAAQLEVALIAQKFLAR